MKTVLCVMPGSNYYKIPGLDLWDKNRDAYRYTGSGKVVAHPPCQQWSKLRAFAKKDDYERELAPFCVELVKKYGGVLEHPLGTSLFKYMGIPVSKLRKVYQSNFGFPAPKPTLLFAVDIELRPEPLTWILPGKKVADLHTSQRSKMPLSFCQYLIDSVYN